MKDGRQPGGAPASAAELSPRVVDTTEGLEVLAPAWDDLRRTLEASPFVGPTLYRAWLAEHGRRVRPLVVAVEDADGQLRAVAPLVRRGPLAYSLPGRVKVAGELLVAADEGADAWRAILGLLMTRQGIRILLVPHATDDGRGEPGLAAASSALGLRLDSLPRFRRYGLSLDGSFEEHLQRWPRNQRAHLRKARNKLERLGPVTFREVAARDGYEELRAIHRRQWAEDETISWLHTEEGARIDRRLIDDVPSKVLFLELDGEVIAATLSFDSGHSRVALYATRDVDVRVGSPGEVLHAEFVRRAFAEGIRSIDFMGEGGHKERWALEAHQGLDVAVAAGGLVGRAALATRRGQMAARGLVQRRFRSSPP